jgi:hypothetical protein
METKSNPIDLKQHDVKAKKSYMYVNVILTFNTLDECGDSQEFFDIYLPINKSEPDAVQFIHKKLFKRIVKKCEQFNRLPGDLIKISTSSDWDLFTEVTGLKSLSDLGHTCKWYFGNGRCDLDLWEKAVSREFGFGANADMSFIDVDWVAEMRQQIEAHQASLRLRPTVIDGIGVLN